MFKDHEMHLDMLGLLDKLRVLDGLNVFVSRYSTTVSKYLTVLRL